MNFIYYLKINKKTILHGLKITGLIFSVISIIILLLTEDLSNFWYATKMFTVAILIGNAFGVFIIFLGAINGYTDALSFFKFYDYTSDEFKEYFGIVLKANLNSYNTGFARFFVDGTKKNTRLRFNYDNAKRQVLLTLLLDYRTMDEEAFYYNQESIKKYNTQSIILSRWGLQKAINLKAWRKMNLGDVDRIFYELNEICRVEKLPVIKSTLNG